MRTYRKDRINMLIKPAHPRDYMSKFNIRWESGAFLSIIRQDLNYVNPDIEPMGWTLEKLISSNPRCARWSAIWWLLTENHPVPGWVWQDAAWVLFKGVAIVSGYRATRLIIEKGEQLGISAQAHGIAFLRSGWENRIEWSPWSFRHLRIGVLDPYDWVLSKLARWRGHDEDDVKALLPRLDGKQLFERLKDSLPDYIGRERDIQITWNILAGEMGYKDKFRL